MTRTSSPTSRARRKFCSITRGGRVEALLMFCVEPVIDRILEDVELQDVAANRKFNAVEACLEMAELAKRIASAGRNDPDDLAAGLILQRHKKALRASGEICRSRLRSKPRPAMNCVRCGRHSSSTWSQ
jgi:hypothetical protein